MLYVAQLMTITFYGEGCFKAQSGDFVILADPIDPESGLTPPRFKSNIILKTLVSVSGGGSPAPTFDSGFICGAGEYNIKEINVNGFSLTKESTEKFLKTIYLVQIENIRLCFFGHLSEALDPAILEHLEGLDVLFVPAGGQPFISQNLAAKIIKQLEPKIVIPSFYKIPGLKRQANDLKLFLEEFNGPKERQTEPQEKLVIKKKDLADVKKTTIIILKP